MSTNMESSIIKGEDSESDDEQLFCNSKNQKLKEKNIIDTTLGNVIDGEAPESDDDIVSYSNTSIATAKEVKENYSSNQVSPTLQSPNHYYNDMNNSLLHNKLVERNILFWQHLNSVIQNTILTNSKQLIEADQLLIKSLITLQTASKTIKQIEDNTTQLLQKSQNILTGNFLPTIKFKN